MAWLLWIVAVVMIISGIWRIFTGDILWGVVLIVLGFVIGPGGVSLFT